jgi:outer membrane protein OmpA-like peptidoglycan-associated protein
MNRIKAVVAAALLAGCASTPPADDTLNSARASVGAAQSDPQVLRFARTELDEASRSLTAAEGLWQRGAGSQEIAHQAYLSQQQARTARELAQSRAAEAELANAAQQRERVVLESRLREAEQAREKAEALAREAESKTQSLERQAVIEKQAATDRQAERARAQARLDAQIAQLPAKQTARGWVLTLGEDLFVDGQTSLAAGGRRSIEDLARVLREHPPRNVVIEAFTDNSGGEIASRVLSERRARAVRDALVQGGVAAQRIDARGMGASFPLAGNDNPAGRQMNRRVEIVIPQDDTTARSGTGATR